MGVSLCLFLLIVSNFSLLSQSAAAKVIPFSNETDGSALLELKRHITSDPSGVVSSWNDSVHFCEWKGVSCSGKHPQRVTSLNLSSQGVSGSISPSIGNLTFLKTLLLMENAFYGDVPQAIGHLHQLQHLNLSFNALRNSIPVQVTNCSELKLLDLSSNYLTGMIPVELGRLSKLHHLILDNNSFVSYIPSSLGNLSSLIELSINCVGGSRPWSYCLKGSIPDDLGRLRSLGRFDVSGNNLSGVMPPSLFNLSSLRLLGVGDNNLQGILPPTIGTTLPNLQLLALGGNRFSGPIPASLSNASKLAIIDIPQCNLFGRIPHDFGRAGALRYVNFEMNKLEAPDVSGWRFMDSLTNCSRLRILALDGNQFGGELPGSIANLSMQLEHLYMGNNKISGTIPSGIQNLVSLTAFDLRNNLLTGTIPQGIGKLFNLQVLALYGNRLAGSIPASIGNLTRLLYLYLSDNYLEGPIPRTTGNLLQVTELDISSNRLNGSIPREVLSLPYLSNFIVLSNNLLSGSLPVEVGSLKNIRSLLLSGNQLSGQIPTTLGHCESLEQLILNDNSFHGAIPPSLSNIQGLKLLDLSQNSLSGMIPSSFSDLKGLQELYLSHNDLTGPIPQFLENLDSLLYLNLSDNKLQGEVPRKGIFRNATATSLAGNARLCGGIPEIHLPPCPAKASKRGRGWPQLLLRVASPIAGVILFASFAFLIWLWLSRKKASTGKISAVAPFPRISYGELAKATDGFSSANLVGKGRHGSVYKGSLGCLDGTVAVKVFNLGQQGASKSFFSECEALRAIRHRNIIKILTSCSSVDSTGNDFKALVYEFMANASLQSWLHPEADAQNESSKLSFVQRLNVAVDVADALEYLHHHCRPPVAHCDLKPGNILLDDELGAHVGDFGIADVLLEDGSSSPQASHSSIGIRGSIGYVAPEYGVGSRASTTGDVYSYGILLLEMLTGKSPVDKMFEDGLTIREFAEMHVHSNRAFEMIDPQLRFENNGGHNDEGSHSRKLQECLVSLVELGLSCSNLLPSERTSMVDVAAQMHAIKTVYLGVRIHEER